MKTPFKLLHWIPRIIIILAILLLSLLSVDAFSPGLTLFQQLGGFFMHMIPSFALTGLLIVAWKRELPGGILFILIGLGFSPFIYSHNFKMNHSVGMSLVTVLILNLPFIIAGILFIISYHVKKKARQQSIINSFVS